MIEPEDSVFQVALSPENLNLLQLLEGEDTIMSKFLRDNRRQMEGAVARMGCRDRSDNPSILKRISSTSTVKSVYVDSPPTDYQEKVQSDSIASDLEAVEQARIETLKRPVFYNLLIAGDTATGKTEFIETYLNLKCAKYEPQVLREIRQAREEQLMFVHHKIQRVEKSLEFHLDIIDTPGYGKFPTIHYWLRSLKSFIKQQALAYHHQKKLKKRDEREDTRIHLCLYFMDGPRCKESDIAILKALQKYVNILPILSKADTYTTSELRQVKFDMADELYRAGVEFFESGRWEGSLGPCPPFAVICAANPICVSPQLYIYGRKYPWGVCDLNNPNHSDFALLCKLLIGHFFQPAVESTKDKAHFMISKYKEKLKLEKQREKDLKKLTEKKKTLLQFIANVAQAASNMLIR